MDDAGVASMAPLEGYREFLGPLGGRQNFVLTFLLAGVVIDGCSSYSESE
jgi:hypothetical protein